MVVYRFKFDQVTTNGGLATDLIKFVSTYVVEPGDIINYFPSKRDVVLGVTTSIYDELCMWIKENVTFDFEFEEHCAEQRTLTQVTITPEGVKFSVCYMLPLFTPESYLDL
jgi:hypothetical protein